MGKMISVSWNRKEGLGLLALFAVLLNCPARASALCPSRDQPVRSVSLFDGPPQEHADLVPDGGGKLSGYWEVGYLYDSGRFITVRCKYADGKTSDVKLADKVARCDFKVDAKKTLALSCR